MTEIYLTKIEGTQPCISKGFIIESLKVLEGTQLYTLYDNHRSSSENKTIYLITPLRCPIDGLRLL